MKQKGLYFKIGLFFIAILCILTAGIIYLHSDGFQGEPVFVETYIDESVQGLEVGSIVKYRGVSVGTVETITFVPNVYKMDVTSPEYETYSGHVLVVMKLDRNSFPGLAESIISTNQIIDKQVALGLRLKLSYQGITGITFMEADYLDPEYDQPQLDLPWKPEHYYIPSTPSLMASFTQSLDNIYRRLEDMDFEGLIVKMQTTLDSINQAVIDADIEQVRSKAITLFDDLSMTNIELQQFITEAQTLPADIQTLTDQFNSTLTTIESMLRRNEPDAEKLLVDLKVLAQNLRQLSETLKSDPAMFIFSSPPEPSENVK